MLQLLPGDWRSEFDPDVQITAAQAVVTVLCYQGRTGGHAALYLEHIELPSHDAVVQKIHLTAEKQKVVNIVINIDIEEKERNEEHMGRYNGTLFHSWPITPVMVTSLLFAANRFKFKNEAGRYRYRLAGGAVGWLSTRPGTRGVNCADFAIKILGEAGIQNIPSHLFTTPRRVVGA